MAEYPVSIKGVVAIGDQIVLARNDRDEWELIGGRTEVGELPTETLEREVLEESGLAASVVSRPLDSYLFDVLGDGSNLVFIVTYAASVDSTSAPLVVSDEHEELALFSVAEALELPNLPTGYKESIRRFAGNLSLRRTT